MKFENSYISQIKDTSNRDKLLNQPTNKIDLEQARRHSTITINKIYQENKRHHTTITISKINLAEYV